MGAVERRGEGATHRRWVIGICLLLVLAVTLLVAGGLMGTTVAENGDNETADEESTPGVPVLDGAERINDTAVELSLEDDEGIDVDTISPTEFLLSHGELAAVDVYPDGSDASVVLHLTGPVDTERLTIGIPEDTTIQDVDGNQLDTDVRSTVTVDNMDGVPPETEFVRVPARAGETTEIRYTFDEPLTELRVAITGPENRQLTLEDFERVGTAVYDAQLEFARAGNYSVELVRATDEAGNTAFPGIDSPLEVILDAPATTITVDQNASTGTSLTFEANVTGERIESIDWAFGDGYTATGEQVSHTYYPGVYEVSVETVDDVGNEGQDRLVVNLTDGVDAMQVGPHQWPENHSVDIHQQAGDLVPDTFVDVIGAPGGQPVTVEPAADAPPLLNDEPVTLEQLTLTPERNTSAGIGLTTLERDDPALFGVEARTGALLLGGFSVDASITNDIVANASLRVAVSKTELEALDGSPSDVALYRGGTEWERLETTLVEETADYAVFEASTPGFSPFAAMLELEPADEDGEPDEQPTEPDNDDEDDEPEETDPDPPAEPSEPDDPDGPTNETDDETAPANQTEDDPADEPRFEETVEDDTDDDDGGILGFLPLGLLTTLFVYVVIPLGIGYTGLKAVAFYLGY